MTSDNTPRDPDQTRAAVREAYARVVSDAPSCCAPSCCAPNPEASLRLGYSADERAAVPDGADLGLGCGNPQAIAALQPGQTVLDLGSGAGFDCLLAAPKVGPTGRVIGVDMTPAMIERARANIAKTPHAHVEVRLGEIEHLPVADASVDVIISNCVINLSPDKAAVFREAFRVLRRGGRLAIADVVATGPVPAAIQAELDAYTGCVAGAAPVGELEAMMRAAGFEDVSVRVSEASRAMVSEWVAGAGAYVASATIEATKR